MTQVEAVTVALNGPSHLERWEVTFHFVTEQRVSRLGVSAICIQLNYFNTLLTNTRNRFVSPIRVRRFEWPIHAADSRRRVADVCEIMKAAISRYGWVSKHGDIVTNVLMDGYRGGKLTVPATDRRAICRTALAALYGTSIAAPREFSLPYVGACRGGRG